MIFTDTIAITTKGFSDTIDITDKEIKVVEKTHPGDVATNSLYRLRQQGKTQENRCADFR